MSDRAFSPLLRRWATAGELRADLAEQGYEASEVAIRQWWNAEYLPSRAWAPLVAAAEKRGFKNITLPALAAIAGIPRKERIESLAASQAA